MKSLFYLCLFIFSTQSVYAKELQNLIVEVANYNHISIQIQQAEKQSLNIITQQILIGGNATKILDKKDQDLISQAGWIIAQNEGLEYSFYKDGAGTSIGYGDYYYYDELKQQLYKIFKHKELVEQILHNYNIPYKIAYSRRQLIIEREYRAYVYKAFHDNLINKNQAIVILDIIYNKGSTVFTNSSYYKLLQKNKKPTMKDFKLLLNSLDKNAPKHYQEGLKKRRNKELTLYLL